MRTENTSLKHKVYERLSILILVSLLLLNGLSQWGIREYQENKLLKWIVIVEPNQPEHITVTNSADVDLKREGRESVVKPQKVKVYSEQIKVVDINTADSLAWVSLRGIGPVFYQRINRFRKALGGFQRIEQISEVYGLPAETFQSIRKHLTCSPVQPWLKINTADQRNLASHAYLTWAEAKQVIALRNNQKFLDSLDFTQRAGGLSHREKLVPYILWE